MADLEKGASILEEKPSATARRSEEVTVTEEESESGRGGSSSNDQPAAAAAIADDDWLRSIMTDQDKSPYNTMPEHVTIPKVPSTLWKKQKQRSKTYYNPEVVSIGPYHHDDANLKSFEELKIRMTREFCGDRATELYKEVAKVAGEVRNCYDDSTKALDATTFTRMIFLDGCFVSHFIKCISTDSINYDGRETLLKMMKSCDIAFVRRDLLLLKNQLPFKVLQALMSRSEDKDLTSRSEDEVMSRSEDKDSTSRSEDEDLIHDFIWQTWLHSEGYLFLGRCIWLLVCCFPLFKIFRDPRLRVIRRRRQRPGQEYHGKDPLHLLEILWRQLIEPKDSDDWYYLRPLIRWYPRRSAMDLKMVGIHFRPSQTERLTDITFKSAWWTWGGILTLPPINIDDTSISMLSNLVAYETSPGSSADRLGVTNYICFLDSMIASANDVKELKYAGIISNFLRNDEAAVEAIHRIADGLVPDDKSYSDVKFRIEEYHNHRRKTRIAIWISEVMRDHFRNPWTAIAVLAALLILCLTFLQTFFTIFPRK